MTQVGSLYHALVERVVEGPGEASQALRRAAFANEGLNPPLSELVDKVAQRPYRVSDADIAAVRADGLSEDQVFELVVCAAIGQSARQYQTALAALDLAMESA